MFLLENQIPYSILEALMTLMPEIKVGYCKGKSSSYLSNGSKESSQYLTEMITKFLKKKFSGNEPVHHLLLVVRRRTQQLREDYEPVHHLLDFLRFKLIGEADSLESFKRNEEAENARKASFSSSLACLHVKFYTSLGLQCLKHKKPIYRQGHLATK